jgi:Tol biopolymer transport system component
VPAPIISSTKRDDGPACSPDGRRIAFLSERSGTPEIWVCDRDGSNAQQLTSFQKGHVDGLQWSPDGGSIAVTLWGGEGSTPGILNAETGALRVLPAKSGGKWASWSRDGQWLYFASRNHPTSIWKIPPAGGEPVQGHDDDMPQPSIDGKYIYFNKGWPGPLSIWRIPVGGGNETKILDGVSTSGQWTVGPDGIYFFAAADGQGRSEMRVYDFATSRIRKILTADHSVGFRIAVSPDGRTIYYPQMDEQGSDLMLVENFR